MWPKKSVLQSTLFTLFIVSLLLHFRLSCVKHEASSLIKIFPSPGSCVTTINTKGFATLINLPREKHHPQFFLEAQKNQNYQYHSLIISRFQNSNLGLFNQLADRFSFKTILSPHNKTLEKLSDFKRYKIDQDCTLEMFPRNQSFSINPHLQGYAFTHPQHKNLTGILYGTRETNIIQLFCSMDEATLWNQVKWQDGYQKAILLIDNGEPKNNIKRADKRDRSTTQVEKILTIFKPHILLYFGGKQHQLRTTIRQATVINLTSVSKVTFKPTQGHRKNTEGSNHHISISIVTKIRKP